MIAKAGIAALLGAGWILLTAADAPSPAALESSVLDEINYARQHPREYAERLREYRNYFEGQLLFLPGDANGTVTREGVSAVDEAIDFLEHQAPLPPLAPGAILAAAARDHAYEQGETGATGHVSRDGASPGDRVRRHGGDIYVGETIAYGARDPEAVVRNLIVDDGVPGRGHRTLIFSDRYHYAGVGCGEHARYRTICVVDYSGTPNGNPVLPAGMKGASLFVYKGTAAAAR